MPHISIRLWVPKRAHSQPRDVQKRWEWRSRDLPVQAGGEHPLDVGDVLQVDKGGVRPSLWGTEEMEAKVRLI